MKVYLMVINYSGWEDPEANGYVAHVFDSEEKAVEYMNKAVKEEIEEEKEYGRVFHEDARYPKYVSIVSQNSEYIEFEVSEREVM